MENPQSGKVLSLNADLENLHKQLEQLTQQARPNDGQAQRGQSLQKPELVIRGR